MQVRIVKWNNPDCWYCNLIGKIFTVDGDHLWYRLSDNSRSIYKSDAVEILTTKTLNGSKIRVNSPEESDKVQRILFQMGGANLDGSTKIRNFRNPAFILIYKDLEPGTRTPDEFRTG